MFSLEGSNRILSVVCHNLSASYFYAFIAKYLSLKNFQLKNCHLKTFSKIDFCVFRKAKNNRWGKPGYLLFAFSSLDFPLCCMSAVTYTAVILMH